MRYFYCPDCGTFMDEIESLQSNVLFHNEVDSRKTEYVFFHRCIECGSDYLEEAAECEECGELRPESELEEGLCKACYERWEKENASE